VQEIGSHASLKKSRIRMVTGLDLGGFDGAQEILIDNKKRECADTMSRQ
jgi:hypothetical protein